MKNFFLSLALLTCAGSLNAVADDPKLTGTPIGTSEGVQYSSNGYASPVSDIQGYAFDGDLDTYFASAGRSYTWVGLDLGSPHVISRVGWAPRNDNNVGSRRLRTGIIQGANNPDFLDALPIAIIRDDAPYGVMTYSNVDCSRGFRYVRFVSTGDNRCNIAELEFFGTPGEGDDSHIFQLTNLPTIVINTIDAEEPYDKEHDITCNVFVIADNSISTDKPATIRERGNASRQFPKKPWRIKFDKKQRLLNAPSESKKWTLINNYGDKSLMRNIVAFEAARRLGMAYVPFCQPVDVILNGEYKGCYQLCDQVEVKKGRVDITEMTENDIEGDALTGGYLLEVDGYANEEPTGTWFVSSHSLPITIKSPDLEDAFRQEQYNYIRNFVSQMEDRLYSGDYTPGHDYREMLDVNSFLQHFIVGEFSGNTDTYWSTYMYKDRLDEQLHVGPVWDFDIAFANDSRTAGHLLGQPSSYLYLSSSSSSAGTMRTFVNRIIFSDPRTARDLTTLWNHARNSLSFTADEMNEFIDRTAADLEQSQQLNFKRWDIMRKAVHMNPSWRLPADYDDEISKLKQYVSHRFETLDRIIGFDPDSGLTEISDNFSDPDSAFSNLRIDGRSICLNGASPFEVYAIDGTLIHSGTEATPQLPAGIYIIRAASACIKIALR